MRKELTAKFFSENPRFGFLSDKDKYLFAKEPPEYKFNVIGAGTMGQEHMYVTTLEGRAMIHGVFDPHPSSIETAKQEYAQYSTKQLKIYESLEQACHDPDIDGILICTPNHTHIDIVRIAAASGKHILLEKPMATSLPDAYEITRIADEYSGVFQIGLQYRYKSIYLEAVHEALSRRVLGDIKTMSMLEHRPPFFDKVGQWNKFSRFSGGTLVEKCCHYFDLLNLFAQSKPASVFASGSMAQNFKDFEYDGERSDIIDNAVVMITYENGLSASFNLNMFSPVFYEELVVCGSEGRLKAFEEFDFSHAPEARSQIEIQHGDNRARRLISPKYASIIEQSGHHGATFYEHRVFVDNIKGIDTHSANAEQGFWSVVVGVAAEKSLMERRLVDVNDLLSDNSIRFN